ncbi:WD repeat domain-containing protein 83 [Tanacetum coccineum]
MDSMKPKRSIREAHKDVVLTARCNHSGDKLLTGGEDMVINLWDPNEGSIIDPLEATAMKNDSHFYSCDGDGSIYYLDLATGERVNNLEYHNGEGGGVVSGGSDYFMRVRASDTEILHNIKVMNVRYEQALSVELKNRRVTSMAIHPDHNQNGLMGTVSVRQGKLLGYIGDR